MVSEQFSTIVKKERIDDLIPFLKSLSKDEKKEFASALKPIAKEYLEFKTVASLIGGSTFKQKATPVQANIIYGAAFTCLNRKDYRKLDAGYQLLLQSDLLDKILSWHCPNWFSDYVNDISKQGWMPWNFKYDHAMLLAEKGYLYPSDELIVRLLPQIMVEQGADHKFRFVPENLTKRAITLEKHIWLIFQFETTIHGTDRWHQFQNSNKDVPHWSEALKRCSTEGMLDRHRLLKESILATGRNFNKALSGWFVDLFEHLEPTGQELLGLQRELLNALSSQHGKAVKTALNAIKEFVEEDEFNANGFLENAPILLSSETKSVVSTSLVLFEKLLRKNGPLKEEICVAICQAFIHNDENIQIKAAKLLIKYHDGSQSVTNEIIKYGDSMLMSSKKLLHEFISRSHPIQESNISPTNSDADNLVHPVPEISSLDELIFLASQAFDNNDPLHIDLLPAALVNLQNEVTGATLHKFEPALQRAYSFIMNDWPSTMGYLDHLLATFFVHVSSVLIDRFPDEGTSLKQIHETFKKKDDENKAKWKWYESRILDLTTWTVASKDTTYIVHKAILLTAYQKIKVKDQMPLLSTPTHQYGYLDPVVLVRRLARYQQKNIAPENYDVQLAISRVAPFNHLPALQEASETLKGELLAVLQFVLNKEINPTPPFTTPSLWIMAGVTKSPQKTYKEFNSFFYSTLPPSVFTGNVPWKSFTEHFKTTRYNYEKRTNEEIPAQHNILKLTLPPWPTIWQAPEEKSAGVLSKLVSLFSSPKKSGREEVYVLYEFLSLKARFLSAEHNDIQRFAFLFPSNPNPLLALVASKALTHSTFSTETDKKIVTKTLEALINLKFHFTEITNLFIASCMLTSDKTVRSFAAEVWIKGINAAEIDSTAIGQILGTHLSSEYAPLKRFTDLISSNLVKISHAHNTALEGMLVAVIENLPVECPIGTKRLLELYSEILSLNNSSVISPQAKQNLLRWTASSGLKKVISSLAVADER